MKKIALFILPLIFLFSTCALEIANVIGPGGGYVFDDKGTYDGGWRYTECSQYDFGELPDVEPASLARAVAICQEHSGGQYYFGWELPDEAQMRKMLECFSYGLTRFSSDYYYLALAVNQPPGFNPNDATTWGEVVVLHKNFDNALNGEVEKVDTALFIKDDPNTKGVIRIRPVRKF